MAHAFSNIGFETAGATPGLASGWSCAIFATAEEYASYDVTVPEPVEDFEEEWATNNEDGTFVLTATAAASYDVAQPEPYEDFEEDWSNTPFSLSLLSVAVAAYDILSPEDFEDFESEWDSNETDITEFVGPGTDITVSSYDLVVPEAREDFEEERRERAARDQLAPKIHIVASTGNKMNRIGALDPVIYNGHLKFCSTDIEVLDQWRDLPRGKHDDAPDATERAIWLLDAPLPDDEDGLDFLMSNAPQGY